MTDTRLSLGMFSRLAVLYKLFDRLRTHKLSEEEMARVYKFAYKLVSNYIPLTDVTVSSKWGALSFEKLIKDSSDIQEYCVIRGEPLYKVEWDVTKPRLILAVKRRQDCIGLVLDLMEYHVDTKEIRECLDLWDVIQKEGCKGLVPVDKDSLEREASGITENRTYTITGDLFNDPVSLRQQVVRYSYATPWLFHMGGEDKVTSREHNAIEVFSRIVNAYPGIENQGMTVSEVYEIRSHIDLCSDGISEFLKALGSDRDSDFVTIGDLAKCLRLNSPLVVGYALSRLIVWVLCRYVSCQDELDTLPVLSEEEQLNVIRNLEMKAFTSSKYSIQGFLSGAINQEGNEYVDDF